jgi:predicted GNAT family acetyltransferase
MRVTRFSDPNVFLARAGTFLTRSEAENNLMLGIGGMSGAFGDTAYLAVVEDAGLVVACALRALPGEPTDPRTHAVQRIRAGSLFLWEHEQPVSMAGWAGRTERGVRVNFVYTPPEHRYNGYATACVAALTRRLLHEGQTFCCLFADLSNPTANAIYQRIGYGPVCDLSDYILSARKDT